MKRTWLSLALAAATLTLSAAPARADHGLHALGGFLAGTLFGAALAAPPVYAAPAYPPPVYYAPRAAYVAPSWVPGSHVVRYDDCGRRAHVWFPGHYRHHRHHRRHHAWY